MSCYRELKEHAQVSTRIFLGSLERLVDNLTKDEFKFLHKVIDRPKQQELLLREGVYPYDYVDGPAKLTETQLSPKKEFYSKLYEEGISDEDYQHAKKKKCLEELQLLNPWSLP